MAEDHGALETAKLSRTWARGSRDRESLIKRAALRVRSLQNDMSGVLGQANLYFILPILSF